MQRVTLHGQIIVIALILLSLIWALMNMRNRMLCLGMITMISILTTNYYLLTKGMMLSIMRKMLETISF